MSDFNNLPGSDISLPTENIRSLSRSDAIISRLLKTVVVSVMREEDIEYTIVPLRPSYVEAVATAFEALGDHLKDLTPDSICLMMEAKNFDGGSIWASISPALWNEIVSEGTELRIFLKSTPTIARATESSGRIYTDRQTITIKLPASSSKDGCAKYLTMLLPKSYDEARKLALHKLNREFKKWQNSWEDVVLRGLIDEKTQEGEDSFETYISTYGTGENIEWERLIIRMKREYPRFKIVIRAI